MNNLQPSDLDLLPILEALIEERHVSRAAIRLNRSQPAVSHALARLRDIFNDPLLVRGEGGLQPTARALQLVEPLTEALGLIRAMAEQPHFDVEDCDCRFHLSMSDYGAAILLPALVSQVRRSAPQMDLSIVSYGRERAIAALIDGEIDLAVGVYPTLKQVGGGDLRSTLLFEDSFACLFDGRSDDTIISFADYLERPHVRVAIALQDNSEVDEALARLGRKRRIAIQVPHWSAAPDLVRGSDLILTAAKRSFEHHVIGNLQCSKLPFQMDSFPFVQTWHRRRERDAAHRWLRDQVALAARSGSGM